MSHLKSLIKLKKIKVIIVGMGYVGLPLAIKFAEHFNVIGFDINNKRITDLKKKYDSNSEVSKESFGKVQKNIKFTDKKEKIREGDIIIISVPTPITKSKKPDLFYLESASKIVGNNLKKTSTVVYESTTYPGCTEEFCLPILEKESGLKLGEFFIAYSPERINPSDKKHSIDQVCKIVAGCNSQVTERLAEIYGTITKVYKASSIKIAESAKVIENIQRDINIALFNELAILFDKMNIDSKEVFDAAATKWNFLKFYPGLVGGHCIPVDPYYLAQKSLEKDYIPELILAGRKVNECLDNYIAQKIIKLSIKSEKSLYKIKVLILGAAYKENVSDLRNSKIENLIAELKNFGLENIYLYDPLLKTKKIFNIKNKKPFEKYDIIVYAVNHKKFNEINIFNILNEKGILIDINRLFNKKEFERKGFIYWGL